jgi:hypothetical protein
MRLHIYALVDEVVRVKDKERVEKVVLNGHWVKVYR